MGEILFGFILLGVVGYGFYIIAKKLNIFERNQDQNDDFSCH